MIKNTLNICQVSLNENIPLIIENYQKFKKLYGSLKIHIICPKHQLNEFKKKLNFEDIKIINEEEIFSFEEFNKVFERTSEKILYQKDFKKRLGWYYQQILKITFAINFVNEKRENIVIWDADTIILKKINFFEKGLSIKYGNFFEFHKAYYLTNDFIFKNPSKYFISFLNQFIAISKEEMDYLLKNYLKVNLEKKNLGLEISELILKSIFMKHQKYNGSLFSEYEFIGQSNYSYNYVKQKPLLFLRFGLDGKLTKTQKFISIFLDYKHVTYEHAHPSFKNLGMLNRSQSWYGFSKILIKNFFKFYLRYIRHNIIFFLNDRK